MPKLRCEVCDCEVVSTPEAIWEDPRHLRQYNSHIFCKSCHAGVQSRVKLSYVMDRMRQEKHEPTCGTCKHFSDVAAVALDPAKKWCRAHGVWKLPTDTCLYKGHEAADPASPDSPETEEPSEPSWEELSDEAREPLIGAACRVLEAHDLLICTRTWNAWSVGTMGENDFVPAFEDDNVANDVAEDLFLVLQGFYGGVVGTSRRQALWHATRNMVAFVEGNRVAINHAHLDAGYLDEEPDLVFDQLESPDGKWEAQHGPLNEEPAEEEPVGEAATPCDLDGHTWTTDGHLGVCCQYCDATPQRESVAVLDLVAGTDIKIALGRAIAKAAELNAPVRFSFNAVDVMVCSDTGREKTIAAYLRLPIHQRKS